MAKRDIIIACFSEPGGDPEKDAIRKMVYGSDWKNPPYVWSFPDDSSVKNEKGIRSEGYASSARKIQAEGKDRGMIPVILNKITAKSGITDFGRIALVTFSAGNSAARFIMQRTLDQQMIDTFVSLDSTAFMKDPNGQPFEVANDGLGYYQYPTFGLQGLDASAMSVFLHTSIVNDNPNILSTKDSAELVFNVLRGFKTSMDKVRDTSIPSPLDFVPGYYFGALNAGPRTRYWPQGYEGVHVMDRIGNNFRLWLKTNGDTQINGHIACCYDFQRGIYDTFLKPRWNNPEEYSCIGPDCIKQFTPDPPLSGLSGLSGTGLFDARGGFGAFGATETVQVPTTKSVDNEALRETWSALGLPRWDLAYKAGAVTLAAATDAAVTYCFLKR